ncbi:hypothetical protein ASD77_08195 [Pseudoxanthomonas sp. Root65]|nr:hypothetical protein ASD77_08195 [Pseudoxanthomonas sp. Root65]
MTWLYATEGLKMSAVVDFGAGCGMLKAPIPGPKAFNKRPDFMAAKGTFKNVVLLESKGMILKQSSDVSWRSGLAHGLEQTAAGTSWLKSHGAAAVVANEYAVTFGLVENGPSLAVVVDPSEEPGLELGDIEKLALLRHHTANWALAAGQFELAVALVDPEQTRGSIQLVDAMPEVEWRGLTVKLGVQVRSLPWPWYRGPTHFISSNLIRAVARNNLDAALAAIAAFNDSSKPKMKALSTPEAVVPSDDDEIVTLPDGTGAGWWLFDSEIEGPE